MLTKYEYLWQSTVIRLFSVTNQDIFFFSVLTATTQTHQTNLELQRRTPFTSPAYNIDRGVINRWSGPPPEYSVSSSAERSRTNATESMYQTSQINTAENTYGPSANYQRNPGFLLRYTPSTNPDPPPEYSVSCTAGRTVPSEFRDSRDPTVCHQTTESQCCDPPPSYEEAVNSSWCCYCSAHGTVSDNYAVLSQSGISHTSKMQFLHNIISYSYLLVGVYQPWYTCFIVGEAATGSVLNKCSSRIHVRSMYQFLPVPII